MNVLRGRPRLSFLIAAVIASTLAATVDVVPLANAADWSPATPPAQYPLNAGPSAARRRDFIVDVCSTPTQLDCVESIAAFLNGTWVEGTSTSTVNNGPDNTPASRNWTIAGLTALNGETELTVTHLINYTGNLFLQTTIAAKGTTGNRDANTLPRNTKVRATVRTSWVLPTHVSGKMADAKIAVEKLTTSGASRITMEGTPLIYMVVTNEASLTSPTGAGDYEVRDFSMTVSDGRYYPIKQTCIEKSAVMTSENGYGHPLPVFNNGKLDLKMTAPHFRSDGATEHIGIYEAIIPIDMAKCLWGDNVSKLSTFEVQVFETEGTEKNATKSVTVTDEAVIIKASGFTFSSPTVRVAYTTPATSATSSSSSTSSPTTTTTDPKPAKPTGVKVVASRGGGTIVFNRVKGLGYTVVATKGKLRKTIRCSLSATKATCKATGLTAGTWKVTVTPRNGSTSGTAQGVSLRVS